MLVYTCKVTPQDAEAGGSPAWVPESLPGSGLKGGYRY